MLRPGILAVAAAITLAGQAAPVVADTTATSTIAQLTILEPSDSNYKLFHGAVWLDHDKASYSYRWGGAQCGNRDLSETSVQILFASFRSDYQITLEYRLVELRNKSYRCITGFSVSKI